MDKPHVLIIEDDKSVCELLFSCLSRHGCMRNEKAGSNLCKRSRTL